MPTRTIAGTVKLVSAPSQYGQNPSSILLAGETATLLVDHNGERSFLTGPADLLPTRDVYALLGRTIQATVDDTPLYGDARSTESRKGFRLLGTA